MPNPQLLLFDFDGTLADSFPMALAAINSVADEWKYAPVEDSGNLRMKSMRTVLTDDMGLRWYHQWKFARSILPYIENNFSGVDIFQGLKEVLTELSGKYKMGIVSSNKKRYILNFLQKYGIEQCFEFIVSESSLFGKHRVLKKLMHKQKLRNDQLIYIADEVRDIQACKKAGIPVIAVTWGYNHRDILQSYTPDYLIEVPSDLRKLLSE